MPITNNDIFARPSRYTKGYGYQTTTGTTKDDDHYSSAYRSHFRDGNTSLSACIADMASVKTAIGQTHPYDSELILRRIEAIFVEPNRSHYGGYYVPKPKEGYQIRPGHIELRWPYYANGTQIARGADPNHRVRRITTWEIRFRHTFYQDASPNAFAVNANTINSAGYVIVNVGTFAIKSLWFNPPYLDQSRAGATSIWTVDYSFTWRPDTWIEYDWDGSAYQSHDMAPSTVFPTIP